MPTSYNLTGDLGDLLAAPSIAATARAWLETNLDGADALVDTTGQVVRLGGTLVPVEPDGTFTATGLVGSDSTDLNVEAGTLQYQLVVEYRDPGTSGNYKRTWRSGWFFLNATSDIAALAKSVTPAVAATGAEIVAAAAAEADRAELAAEAAVAPTDTTVAALAQDPASATGAALSATFARIYTPQAFGAAGDGVADDTAAVQAAIDAAVATGGGSAVYFPPGTYTVSGVTAAAHGVTLRGAGKNKSFLESSTGDVLTISHEYVTIEQMAVRSQAGGGHCVVIAPGVALAQSRFVDSQFRQFNDGKSVWYFSDTTGLGGGMFDCHWIDCLFRHTTTATVPAFDGYSNTNNFFSANRFTRCRAHSSGTYFFDIRLDAAGTFNYNNVWDSINFEICDGGGIRMWGANNTGIHNPGFFDNGTIVGDLIRFGRTGSNNQSRGNRVTNYHRSGGALSGGAVDIHLVSGQNSGTTLLEGISGTTTAGVTIDLGSSSGYAVVVGYDPTFVTVNNANTARTVLITSDNGVTTPKLTVAGIPFLNGAGSPEGSVTASAGAQYVRTAGSGNTGASRLYVKETGTGNTGWRAANAAPARTTAQLGAASDSVNTTGKAAGVMAFNTTTGRPVWATGAAPTDTWVDATGVVAHTPA